MSLLSTPGGNRGIGHFYLAKNRTFLLCVDRGHADSVADSMRSGQISVHRNEVNWMNRGHAVFSCSTHARPTQLKKWSCFIPDRGEHTGGLGVYSGYQEKQAGHSEKEFLAGE